MAEPPPGYNWHSWPPYGPHPYAINKHLTRPANLKKPRDDGRDLLGFDSVLNSAADSSFPMGRLRPRFPNAIQDWRGTPLTLRERAMISFMGEITDKPDWTRKVFDDGIVVKWSTERMVFEKEKEPERQLSEEMLNYCIKELQDYAKQQEQRGFIPAIDADATVYKSDTIIPEEIKKALAEAAAPLEDVPDSAKDWHPNSDEKVLDLVHPSLFPLLYGRSRILDNGKVDLDDCDKYTGKGEIMPIPDPDDLHIKTFSGLSSWRAGEQHFISSRFQWLPSEVSLTDDGEAKLSSYINNLHPRKHKPLYNAIEKVITKAIPMWEATLRSTERGDRPSRIDISDAEYIEPEGKRSPEPDESEMDEDEIYQLDEDWHRAARTLVMPEPAPYKERADWMKDGWRTDIPEVDLKKDWSQKGLQIIVKLANIHLTPEKPTYDGGTWHIEGQLNERICASALYYYSSENINDSYLSFREPTARDHLEEKPYEQSDFEHFEKLYDIKDQEAATQVLGAVNTREGRLLTFPNFFQHRVSPFSLEDKTKAGHRKILALFLVDPYTRIPSTANVPPQQKAWWKEMVTNLDRVGDLPPELVEHVVDSAGDFPIGLDEAKEIRLQLVEERKIFVQDVDKRFEQETFGFCEH